MTSPRRLTSALLLLILVALAAVWFVRRGGIGSPAIDGSPDALDERPVGRPELVGARMPATPSTAALAEADVATIPSWIVGEAEVEGVGTGRVFVRLVDAAGRVLANHPIEVDWWKGFAHGGRNVGRTNEHGRFRTSANAPWELEGVGIPGVQLSGATLYHPGPFAASPQHADEVAIQMPVPCRIHGRVIDQRGRPVVGCTVSCRPQGTLPLDPFVHRLRDDDQTQISDADGTLEFIVGEGAYVLEVEEAYRWKPTHEAVAVVSGSRRIAAVTLPLATPLAGRTLVVDVEGIPEAHHAALVCSVRTDEEVFPPPAPSPGVTYRALRQIRSGKKERIGPTSVRIPMEGVEGEGWRLVVWVRGGGVVEADVPRGATAMQITLPDDALPRTRVVRIVARLPNGALKTPMLDDYGSGSAWGGGPNEGLGAPLRLDLRRAQARFMIVRVHGFALTGLGPIDPATAPAHIEVAMEEARNARVEVVDAGGRPVNAEVVLLPSRRFFHATDGRRPPRGSGYRPLELYRAVTGDDGVATFDELGSTPCSVIARPMDAPLPPARGVVVGGESLRLVLGEGLGDWKSVEGQLLDAATNAPIVGATVEAWTDASDGERGSTTTLSDGDGRFALRGFPARPTRVLVKARGYAFPALQVVDLQDASGPITLRLHRTRRLPLRIVDAEGRPRNGVRVSLRWPDDRPLLVQDSLGNRDDDELETDIGGRVDFLGVPAVRVQVVLGDTSGREIIHEVDLAAPLSALVTLAFDG